MHNYYSALFVFLLIISQSLVQPATAQEEKSLKESWTDLKKSFHTDKAFIMPFSDSANDDVQAFLFEVKEVKGVNGARLSLKNQKVAITVDTKQSMVSVWNNLPKEMRTRYTVSERTPNGFILSDSYQNVSNGNKNTRQQ
jgi:hypothetical protein